MSGCTLLCGHSNFRLLRSRNNHTPTAVNTAPESSAIGSLTVKGSRDDPVFIAPLLKMGEFELEDEGGFVESLEELEFPNVVEKDDETLGNDVAVEAE